MAYLIKIKSLFAHVSRVQIDSCPYNKIITVLVDKKKTLLSHKS